MSKLEDLEDKLFIWLYNRLSPDDLKGLLAEARRLYAEQQREESERLERISTRIQALPADDVRKIDQFIEWLIRRRKSK